jgi:hypothetical protein
MACVLSPSVGPVPNGEAPVGADWPGEQSKSPKHATIAMATTHDRTEEVRIMILGFIGDQSLFESSALAPYAQE